MKKILTFGLDCTAELQELSKTCTKYHDMSTHQVSTVCKVSSGRFLMPVQHGFLLPVINNSPRWPDDLCMIDIYRHIQVNVRRTRKLVPSSYPYGERQFYGLMWCIENPDHDQDCEDCKGMYKCVECTTEYEIAFKKLREDRVVLVYTVWRDFGDVCSTGCVDWEAQNYVKLNRPRDLPCEGPLVKRMFGDMEDYALVDGQDSKAVDVLYLVEKGRPDKPWDCDRSVERG
ncbi:hypothetical protein DL98DRAFT_531959 [Cadophora sp. DSE1049]|nr:hypothetical protein DL98DRAFT_531959 [Cadophora sp. DSE1049]